MLTPNSVRAQQARIIAAIQDGKTGEAIKLCEWLGVAADAWEKAIEDRDYWKSIAMDWERKGVDYMKRLEEAEDALTDLRSLHYQMQTVIREHGEHCAALAREERP